MRHGAVKGAVLRQLLSTPRLRVQQISPLHRTIMSFYQPHKDRDYIPLADHALIGNLRTAALVSLDGSVESYCVPNFDSPSVFARILDKDKGGHFSITPTIAFSVKQNYLPSSNVLQTKFMNDQGVASVTDFLPRPSSSNVPAVATKPLLPWLIRRVECIRGSIPLMMQCAPAFNYARDAHTTELVTDASIPPSHDPQQKVVFTSSSGFTLDLRYIAESTADAASTPVVQLGTLDLTSKGHKGLAAYASLQLSEGQAVTFILRTPPETPHAVDHKLQEGKSELERKLFGPLGVKARTLDDPFLTKELLHNLLSITNRYWYEWIRQSTYTGSWKEAVHRSALALKLLIFEPTGAVVASPTFSLPEFIGGTRNWDYRASWIRDSSFTLYALIRLGFTQEANAYMEFIFERLRNKNPDGSLQIMYTIHGGKDLEEIELTHLDGHKGSKPVRIGNGAADHVQLDIYGELMDCIYLGQKFGKPLGYDDWVLVRELWVTSIILVRGWSTDASSLMQSGLRGCELQGAGFVRISFSLSPPSPSPSPSHHNPSCGRGALIVSPSIAIVAPQIDMIGSMFIAGKCGIRRDILRVAIDRGLRLAEKRSLPCPNRVTWLEARDELYEEIMHKAWNAEGRHFGQSYEETDVLDSAVLIMPLVFFMHGSDPRFVSTLKQILKTPERGGLTSNNLVYRYDVRKSDDGVGGEEGTFSSTFDGQDFLLYLNHVGLCTEEISEAGEALGNAVQGFTHVTLISAAYNLSRTLAKVR
ncbi:hypothetical protein D9615_010437 [Tricholomella constricta]|uniref:Glycoside hydrolase family 15 protein n=1 Tax=Tricholomella constricta TaxID=117010 RepID=A0A8H5LTS1_9AGAR|nr:hypothetical protein D9615_010437 [Tricholomella constricta]